MPGTVRPPSAAELLAIAHSRGNDETAIAVSAPHSLSMSSASMPRLDLAKVCPTCGVRYPAEFKVCPRDASELNDIEQEEETDELIGTTLGSSYTIVRVIGEGGMGRVYEARHTRINSKRFAVKMLHPEFSRQPEVLTRFQREAEAAAAIRSPYVVDVYDVDRTPDGRPYIVGEFLEGKEFAEYLDKHGRMKAGQAVRLVRHVCKALIAAHQKGVIHRDMKPENVFLVGDSALPVAKVIDFGISKHGDKPGTALTKTGMIMGTPSYMAPEQARGERVDHRADIYAVGAILYCALTGQRPFDRNDPTATLTAVLIEDPPRPRSLEPTIPEGLEMIIQRAMSKRAQDRYDSMAELDAELAPWEPISEADSSLVPHGGQAWSRMSNPDKAMSGPQDKQARTVAMARPMILVLGALGLFFAAASLLTAITAVVRITRGGGGTANLKDLEPLFLILGTAFTLLTPLILAGRYLSRTVWENSVKSVELAERLRLPVLVGLSAYGFSSLLVRLLEAVVLRRAVGVAWPWWDLLMFLVGVGGGLGSFILAQMDRKKA